jgi:hypothetical protein
MLRQQSFQFRKKSWRFRVVHGRSSLAQFSNAIFDVMNFHRY